MIIPTRNRAELLNDLLESLSKLDASRMSWEILVIDNGSTDKTEEICLHHQNRLPVPLRYIKEPLPGLHRARNRGAKEAHGDILAYLDDDMTVAPTWLSGAQLILDNQADVVTGKILPRWHGKLPEWASVIYDGTNSGHWGLFDHGDQIQPISPDQVAGGNCFIPKKLISRYKGFHPDGMPEENIHLRGDGETGLFRRLAAEGYRTIYSPHALVYHIMTPEKLTLEYIQARAFRQGISDSYSEVRQAKGVTNVIHTIINDAYLEGKIFHRRKVLEDKELLSWVLQDHYLDE